MTADGSPYTRFQRALDAGQLLVAMSAAAELPRVNLDDALRLCLLLRDERSELFHRATVRWVGRFALEAQPRTLDPVLTAAAAFKRMPDAAEDAMETLAALCAAHHVS